MPLTWRNVNINSGADAAAFGSVAKGFGDAALQGFSIFSDQMGEQIARTDKLLTNEAIANALRGGPRIASNPRVDATALQTAVNLDDTTKSDLLTASLDQAGKRTSNEQSILDLQQDKELFPIEKKLTLTQIREARENIAQSAAARQRDEFGLGVDRFNFTNTQEDRALAERARDDTNFLNQKMAELEQQEFQRLVDEAYNDGTLKAGEQPTQAMWDRFSTQAQAYAQGRGGRTIARQLATSRGVSKEAWDASGYGALDTRAAALEDELILQQKAEYAKDVEELGQFTADMRWGNFDRAVASSDGKLVPGSEEDLKSNAKTYNDAVKYLGNAKLPVDKYGDDEQAAIEAAIEVFPHPSVFVPIVRSYTVNGKLDHKKLLSAVRDGGVAALDQAKIVRANEERGFSIGAPGATPSTPVAGTSNKGVTAQDLIARFKTAQGNIATIRQNQGAGVASNLELLLENAKRAGSSSSMQSGLDSVETAIQSLLKSAEKSKARSAKEAEEEALLNEISSGLK